MLHENSERGVTLITTFDALMNTMAPASMMWESVLRVKTAMEVDLDTVTNSLYEWDMKKLPSRKRWSICTSWRNFRYFSTDRRKSLPYRNVGRRN